MYYSTGQEVPFANAIDAATTFIGGVGHQMELEAIRSRTKEALRARVRAGRIAGGRCFGYALRRETDTFGRAYTIAVVDQGEANIVRRIFGWYLEGLGLKNSAGSKDVTGLEEELAGLRAEQKRLARAVATAGDDIPEPELRRRGHGLKSG